MAASKLQKHVSSLPGKISPNFQRLYLCFRDPALQWNWFHYSMIKPEVTGSGQSKMAATKLQLHVSSLPGKMSTKFQRLYLCSGAPASHWDSWEYYSTEPEVEISKMAASKLQMHVNSLPDKILSKFQRLYLCFLGPAFHWDSWEYYATVPEVGKCKMAASKLQMHVLSLAHKISTQFQLLHPCFFRSSFLTGQGRIPRAQPEVEKMAISELQIRICTVLLVDQN